MTRPRVARVGGELARELDAMGARLAAAGKALDALSRSLLDARQRYREEVEAAYAAGEAEGARLASRMANGKGKR